MIEQEEQIKLECEENTHEDERSEDEESSDEEDEVDLSQRCERSIHATLIIMKCHCTFTSILDLRALT